MNTNPPDWTKETERIRSTIGRPEVARAVLRPRVAPAEAQGIAAAIRSHLKVKPASSGVACDFANVPASQVTSFATRIWANAISELACVDEELGEALREGAGFVPSDPKRQALYNRKMDERFRFFAWIFGWGGAVGDANNCYTVRLLVLDSVIRIEDLQAKRNGEPGGWGLLNATVEAVRLFALRNGQRLKTTATNTRIENGFRRLGFATAPDASLAEHGPNAKHLELVQARPG